MKQIFSPRPVTVGDVLALDEAIAHHLFDVLRTTSNERVRVIDGDTIYLARTLGKPDLEILEEVGKADRKAPITLCTALIKGDKFEWMLQKATELGVDRIVPFTSENTIVKIDAAKMEKKLQRWQTICDGAGRQCNRTSQVKLMPITTLKDLSAYKSQASFCAYEKEDPADSLACRLQDLQQSITLVIGPEGGLSAKEAQFLEAEGFELVSLGERILRAETAAMYGLCAIDVARSLQACRVMECLDE